MFGIGPTKACLYDEEREYPPSICRIEIKFKAKSCLRNEQSTHENEHQLLKYGLNLGNVEWV